MIQSTLFSLGRRRRRRHRRRRVSSRHWCGVCGTLRRLARECARDAAQSRRLLPEAPQRCHTLARFVNLHRSGRLHILLLGLGQRRLSWPRRLGNRGLPLAQPASAAHAGSTLCKHLFRWPHAAFSVTPPVSSQPGGGPVPYLACSLKSCPRAQKCWNDLCGEESSLGTDRREMLACRCPPRQAERALLPNTGAPGV